MLRLFLAALALASVTIPARAQTVTETVLYLVFGADVAEAKTRSDTDCKDTAEVTDAGNVGMEKLVWTRRCGWNNRRDTVTIHVMAPCLFLARRVLELPEGKKDYIDDRTYRFSLENYDWSSVKINQQRDELRLTIPRSLIAKDGWMSGRSLKEDVIGQNQPDSTGSTDLRSEIHIRSPEFTVERYMKAISYLKENFCKSKGF